VIINTTATIHCSDVTPLDTISPVTLTETVHAIQIQGPTTSFTEADGTIVSGNPSSFTVGVVTLTNVGNGRTMRFVEAFHMTIVALEVYQDTGWAVVGPGAIGNDVTYIEGGSATLNHYGVPFAFTGRTLDVCKALGA